MFGIVAIDHECVVVFGELQQALGLGQSLPGDQPVSEFGGPRDRIAGQQDLAGARQFQQHRHMAGAVTWGEQYFESRQEGGVGFDQSVVRMGPFDGLLCLKVTRSGHGAFGGTDDDLAAREGRKRPNVVNVAMAEHEQVHVFQAQPQERQLTLHELPRPEVNQRTERIQAVLEASAFAILGVLGRKSRINQNVLSVLRLHQKPWNPDGAARVYPKQAKVKHIQATQRGHERYDTPVMHVKMHRLFEVLLETTAKPIEATVGFSLAAPPTLADFLDDLNPAMSLDWSGQSFQGLPALREHVLERGQFTACNASDVLITAGAAEANHLAIMQLLQPEDEIVVETPGWPQPLVLAEAIGARIQRLTRREDLAWGFDFNELEALTTPKTKLIFLTNPNNPTGHLLGKTELERVAQIAQKVGAFVLVDEVYAGLEWTGERAPAIAELYERGITTGSVSKALGLQGLRTGWLISRDRQVVLDALVLRENSSEIMNVMGETIAEIALRPERYERLIANARMDGLRNLGHLERFIAARPELDWVPPQAGLIGLARLSGITSDALSNALLEPPFNTLVIPGSAYGLPQHIRLGVGGGAAANLEEGLRRLDRFLEGERSGSAPSRD